MGQQENNHTGSSPSLFCFEEQELMLFRRLLDQKGSDFLHLCSKYLIAFLSYCQGCLETGNIETTVPVKVCRKNESTAIISKKAFHKYL